MTIRKELLDELLQGYQKPEDVLGDNGLLKQLTKALLERAMQAELTHHLGYDKHDPAGYGSGNSRNGVTPKTLQGDFGQLVIETPRDRNGTFQPQIVPKGQRRFAGFDDQILALYARGVSVRDIQAHLQQIYGVEVSPTLISTVTEAVYEEVKAWQSRPLEPLYAILYLDALWVKMRHEGRVENRAVYVAIGVDWQGQKDVLGLWTSASEGAKFWLGVLTEIKNRGVKDVLVACVDGLKGFPQAITSVFPQATVQLCIVHLVRASLNYVNWKQRKAVASDLKTIYRASTEAQAEQALAAFRQKWDGPYRAIGKLWQEHWAQVVPFFQFPEAVRRVIYTTNAIESLNSSLRKLTKSKGSFPSEEAALKLLYLALRPVVAKWETVQHWKEAMNQFEALWGERIQAALRPTA